MVIYTYIFIYTVIAAGMVTTNIRQGGQILPDSFRSPLMNMHVKFHWNWSSIVEVTTNTKQIGAYFYGPQCIMPFTDSSVSCTIG